METFSSPFFNHFNLSLVRKKTYGNENHEKETKHIHASPTNILHIRKGNLNCCKCRNCKNEAREIDYLCCREVDTMLNTSTKIPERKGSILPFSFYGKLPDY